ncbi:hypothetical protein T265_01194 [Opisthorchis viverrini]|uniref:Uncharacterized protein n=1 Tax=Opisthorchis viverrini TaxID=6198 RepID=A0A074ZZM5_OPIVI|nr:hypothetical protein T265_01194 [Opisthorchis viverrini]KER32918.1 hypothetical protein T265_01194 [Opisthorchis viverrini]
MMLYPVKVCLSRHAEFNDRSIKRNSAGQVNTTAAHPIHIKLPTCQDDLLVLIGDCVEKEYKTGRNR